MTVVGPVCHLPPPNVATPHDPVAMPNIPAAQPTIASLTATVNALRQAFLFYSGQRGPPGARGAAGQNSLGGSPAAPSGSWSQKSISVSKVKIFQNNDPTSGNFVEVERIDKLVMSNSSSPKQTWTWERGG